MSASVGSAPISFDRTRSARFLPFGWALLAMFALYPLWWLLGVGTFIWPLLAVPLGAYLAVSRRWLAPPGFVAWLLFVAWVAVSGLQLSSVGNALTYAFRSASYVSAAVIFLYVVNTSEEELPARRIVSALTWMWVSIAIGGLIGMALPTASFSTPFERLLPGSLLANRWLHDLVHVAFAQNVGERGLEANGIRVYRTQAPFAYTNWWGGNFAVLLPFVLVACRTLASSVLRWLLGAMVVVSVLPLVQSANRGAWVSLALVLIYVTIRLAVSGRPRAVLALLSLVIVVSALIVASPLKDLIATRLSDPGSQSLRTSLYERSIEAATQSPLIGYGVPLPPPHSRYVLPNVGTQGQLWLVLVSAGIPGVVFFIAWVVYVALVSGRRRDPISLAAHAAILITLVQLPVYGMAPIEIQIFMVAAALVWRPLSRPSVSAIAGRGQA